jgi:hypothetical protein
MKNVYPGRGGQVADGLAQVVRVGIAGKDVKLRMATHGEPDSDGLEYHDLRSANLHDNDPPLVCA